MDKGLKLSALLLTCALGAASCTLSPEKGDVWTPVPKGSPAERMLLTFSEAACKETGSHIAIIKMRIALSRL